MARKTLGQKTLRDSKSTAAERKRKREEKAKRAALLRRNTLKMKELELDIKTDKARRQGDPKVIHPRSLMLRRIKTKKPVKA